MKSTSLAAFMDVFKKCDVYYFNEIRDKIKNLRKK